MIKHNCQQQNNKWPAKKAENGRDRQKWLSMAQGIYETGKTKEKLIKKHRRFEKEHVEVGHTSELYKRVELSKDIQYLD